MKTGDRHKSTMDCRWRHVIWTAARGRLLWAGVRSRTAMPGSLLIALTAGCVFAAPAGAASETTPVPTLDWHLTYGLPIAACILLLGVLMWNVLLRRAVIKRTLQLRQELTERKKVEDSLEENRRRLETLMDNLQGIAYRCLNTSNWPMEFISKGCLELTGYPADDFMDGRINWNDLIVPEDQPMVWDTIQQTVDTQEKFQMEYRIVTRGGQTKWVLEKGCGVATINGRTATLEGFITDISQRRQVEQQLRRHQAQLASVFQASPVGIGLVLNRVFLNVNDRICEMTGYTHDELIGRNARMLYPSQEEYDYVGREKYGQIQERGVGAVETRWRRKDGKIIDILLSSAPIDLNDASQGVTFSAQDITNYKLARQTAIAERDRAQQYLDIAAVMLVALDTEGRVRLINKKGCDILECPESRIRGKDWFVEFLPEDIRKQARKVFYELITGQGEPVEYYENTIHTLTGSEKLIAWHNTVIRDEEGAIIGTLSSGLDITEQRLAEEALTESEQRFRNIIESSPMGIHVYEMMEDGRLIFTGSNQAARSILGFDDRMEYGKTIEQAFPGHVESNSGIPEIYRRICREGGSYHGDNFEYQDPHVNAYFEFDAFQTSPGKMAVMFMDVSDRIRTQRQLELIQFALDHAVDGVFLINEQARFEYVNRAACRSLGYTQDELMTMGVADIDPHFDPQAWPSIWESTKLKKIQQIERCHRRKDGSFYPVEITANAMSYQGRELHCVFVHDITARKETQKAMLFTQFAVDHAGESAYWMDSKGRLVYVNDAACQTLGYSRDELLAMSIPDLDPNFPMDKWDEHWDESRRKGSYRIETSHRAKDGRLVPVEVSINFVCYEGVEYHCSFARDITERKRAEEALRESENKHRLLFTGANDAILIMDGEQFIECNPKALDVYGCSVREELIDHSPLDFSPEYQEDDRPSAEKAREYLEGAYRGEPQRFSWVHHKLNGDLFYVEVSLAPLELEGRHLLQAVVRDMTEQRAGEKTREKLLGELRSKNEELEGIVFIASHDLRSPLVNIRGFTGELEKSLAQLEKLLAEEPLSESACRQLKTLFGEDIPESIGFIKSGNRKMDILLNGLLRLSRVGSAELRPNPIRMNAFLEGIVNSFLFRTRQDNITISVEQNLPSCMADLVLLNQVFTNLIDNAIKYRSPDRSAVIHISGHVDDDKAVYCVRDNGIGIAADHIEKVFEIFHRLNPDRSEPGEGLGLTIVRRVLKRMDGHIRIESEPGQGTAAYIELPKA